MNIHARALRLALLGLVAAPLAGAQIESVASETFEYTVPGLLHDGGGGTGWSTNWFVTGVVNNDIVMFNNTIPPAFALSDGVGGHAGQAVAFGQGYRRLDTSQHPDIQKPNGKYGRDGTTMWLSFSSVQYQGMPVEHYGGLSLFNVGVGEELFLGSPWDSNAWGIDDEGAGGAPPQLVAGSSDTVATRLVYRIDFAAGGERLRLWLNPSSAHPSGPADLDTPIADLEFDEISIASGGNNGDHFFWDNIVFEKGKPAFGGTVCPGVPNSTGVPAFLQTQGSPFVAQNDVTFQVTDMPSNAFGFLLSARSVGFVAHPGGSQGNFCLGPDFGRGVGTGIFNSGASGTASVVADLTSMPTSTGPVAAMAGQAWFVQAWYRDFLGGAPTSNLSNAVGFSVQ